MPESKQLVVELELPTVDVVPKVRLYKYVKARDAIEETYLQATAAEQKEQKRICIESRAWIGRGR